MQTASRCKWMRTTSWILQVLGAAAFLFMGALPKLTTAPFAVALFEKLGFPPGMYVVGVAEALAAVLLLTPRAHAIGGLLAVVLMIGAIGSHFGPLGFAAEVTVDGNTESQPIMFPLAIVLLLIGAAVAFLRRDELPIVGARFKADGAASPASV